MGNLASRARLTEYALLVLAAHDPRQWLAENRVTPHPQLIKDELAHDIERRQAINYATLEVNARSLRKVTSRHRHFGDLESESDRFSDDFCVEHEVVRVEQEGYRGQQVARVRAQARVHLRQVRAQCDVLGERQEAIRDVLPDRHTALQRRVA